MWGEQSLCTLVIISKISTHLIVSTIENICAIHMMLNLGNFQANAFHYNERVEEKFWIDILRAFTVKGSHSLKKKKNWCEFTSTNKKSLPTVNWTRDSVLFVFSLYCYSKWFSWIFFLSNKTFSCCPLWADDIWTRGDKTGTEKRAHRRKYCIITCIS